MIDIAKIREDPEAVRGRILKEVFKIVSFL